MDRLQKRYLATIEAVCGNSIHAQALLREGTVPKQDNLVGFGYRGFNTFWGARLGKIQEFMKVFFYDPLTDNGYSNFHGYNLATEQHGPESELELVTKYGGFVVQGAFYIGPVEKETPKYGQHHNAVIFNYGRYPKGVKQTFPLRKNKVGEGRLLRDYVVQPFDDEPGILLGRPYIRIPVLGIHIPVGYFILKRELEVDNRKSCERICDHFGVR